MGVSGSGKSSVGRAIANQLNMEFIEADDYHSSSNRARMKAGKPLDDAMRNPWIDKICKTLQARSAHNQHTVLSCSALRHAHRQRLREAGFRNLFLYLQGDRELVSRRLKRRRSHFMPAVLLDSQYADFQIPADEADVITINIARPLDEVIESAFAAVSDITTNSRELS